MAFSRNPLKATDPEPHDTATRSRLQTKTLLPPAAKLLDALTRGDRRRALQMLTTLYEQGTAVSEIEKEVIAPALVRLGEMWVRGRLGDNSFRRLGSIAEQVERDFRQYIIDREAARVAPRDDEPSSEDPSVD